MSVINKVKIGNTEYDIGADYSNIDNTPNLATVATSGSYSDLSNKPNIPDSTSDLQNDSGFITNATSELENYYTKTEVDGKVSSVYKYKGSVATYADLPSTDLTVGDVYNVQVDGSNYAWTGSAWDKLGGDIDLSGYQTKIDSSHKLGADLVDDTSSTNKFVSASDKTTWNAKYDKPSGGIPSTDLSSAVQTSLGKADTALQEHQDISGKEDKSNKVTSISSDSTDTQYPSAKCMYDSQEEQNELIDKANMIYNALIKTTGTGTSVTIDNTVNAPIEIELAPSEMEQETTTGKNEVNIGTITFEVSKTYDNLNIPAGTYTFSALITSSDTDVSVSRVYLYNGSTSLGNFQLSRNTRSSATITVEQPITQIVLYASNSYNNSVGDTAIYKDVQLESGSTATDYEPYTGGIPAPNPEFPETIHTISGNNTIVLCGKNLFDKTKVTSGKYINSNGEEASYYAYSLSDYMPVLPNTNYTFQGITGYSEYGAYYDKNKTLISAFTESLSVENQHITTPNNCYYVRFTLINTNDNINKFQLEKGLIATTYQQFQSQTYPITLGNLEYSKIGNYKDEFIKTSGKNLFDSEFRQGTEGNTTSALNIFSKNDLVLEAGTYTFSCNLPMTTFKYAIGVNTSAFPGTANWLEGGFQTNQTLTFTINETLHIGVLITRINQTNLSPSDVSSYTFMINKGSTALPYEPYGTGKWYLKKNIGKLVLDGSENWGKQDTWSAVGDETNAFYIEKPANLNTYQPCLCDYLKYVSVNTILNTDDYGISYSASLIIRMPKSLTDSTALKNWLTSNNMTLYYVLTSPIFIEITDTTLISQLNALKNAISYDEQTNISQTNNDLPFIITANAFVNIQNYVDNSIASAITTTLGGNY